MKAFEKFWTRFWEAYRAKASDKDKVHWGYKHALEWVQEVIIEELKIVSYDDNINCVRNIQEVIRSELGAPPASCVRDGFRDICKQCPEKQRLICQAESQKEEKPLGVQQVETSWDEDLVLERLRKINQLEKYFLDGLVEDPQNGSVFDSAILDALKALKNKMK